MSCSYVSTTFPIFFCAENGVETSYIFGWTNNVGCDLLSQLGGNLGNPVYVKHGKEKLVNERWWLSVQKTLLSVKQNLRSLEVFNTTRTCIFLEYCWRVKS